MKLENQKFYIYGDSLYGQALVRYFLSLNRRPLAILDRSPRFDSYLDVPCLKFDTRKQNHEIDLSNPIVVSILGYDDVEQSLSQYGFTDVVGALEAFKLFPSSLRVLNECGFLWMQPPAKSQIDINKCNQVMKILSDQKSKETFSKIVSFRSNPSFEDYVFPEEYEMYFPPDIPGLYGDENLKILDVGGFDGDTFSGFFQRFSNKIRNYTALEISQKNIDEFERRLAQYNIKTPLVTIKKIAVGVPEGFKLKVAENSSASYVEMVGDGEYVEQSQLVERADLGELMAEHNFNVIKMDIEGADYDALCQARRYIAEKIPTMALSLYHKSDDLWSIPLLIDSLAKGKYDFFIRQEGHWFLETQLYVTPKSLVLKK